MHFPCVHLTACLCAALSGVHICVLSVYTCTCRCVCVFRVQLCVPGCTSLCAARCIFVCFSVSGLCVYACVPVLFLLDICQPGIL